MGMKSGSGDKAHLRRNINFISGRIDRQNERRKQQWDLASLLGADSAPVLQDFALEPRILLDAAALETIDQATSSDAPAGGDSAENDTLNQGVMETHGTSAEGEVSTQIVFIDAATGMDANLDEIGFSGAEIYYLDGSSDGVEQIASILNGRSGIDAIHILSHGSSGTLELGSANLTEASITGIHAGEMQIIHNALSQNGDILIYGCNFAAGTRGANAVSALAEATGADVAASVDLTGAANLGGDWELETSQGQIEAIPISPLHWASTLDLAITDVGVGGVGVTGPGVDALAQQILGSGVTINSATYSGGAQQAAIFATGAGAPFGSNILTFSEGAIFSTGTAASVVGPNSQTGFTVNAPGIDGDPQFDALAGNNTFDASFIEISFTPDVPPGASAGDTGRMTMEIVFGSEEYNEYVYGGVNDTLAVIVNGVNQANVPNGLAIGIDTINDATTFNPGFGSPTLDPNPEHLAPGFESANASLYVNNETNAFNTQMDGFTITLPVTFDIIVGQPNTIKIGIADTGDAGWDSWFFVRADSGQTVIVAENDSVTTPTNIPMVIDVTANDYDLQGDPLTVTHILDLPVTTGDTITLASGVDVTVGAGGQLTIQGDGINTANDAFTYQISDGNGGTSTAFVNVTITAPNAQPVAVDDGPAIVTEDIPSSGTVLANDSDADGNPLSVTQFVIAGDATIHTAGSTATIPGVGSLLINTNGSYIFTPDANYFGPVPSTTYFITDNNGGSDSATLTFADVSAVPDSPSLNLDPNNDSGTPGDITDDGADNGGYEVTFVENDPAVAIVDSDMTLTDPEDNVVEVVVTLTNGKVGDTFSFPSSLPGGISGSAVPSTTLAADGSIILTFTGLATTTTADWEALLQSISFEPSSTDNHNPDPADRNINIEAFDSSLNSSGVVQTIIHVVPENDPPTLDLDDDNSSGINAGNYQGIYTENDPGTPVSSGVVITDLDDTNLEGMTITLSNGEVGDILNIGILPAGISLVGTAPTDLTAAGTITVELTGSASLSDYQDAIAAITFANTGENPVGGIRNITVTGNDGTNPTPARTAFITVVPVNDPPISQDPANPGVPADAMPAQSGEDASGLTPFDATPYFSDPDNTTTELILSLDPSTTPAWISVDANGNIMGTPPNDASQNTNVVGGTPGTYEITVIATDPGGLTASTTVTYTITNTAPDAIDDSFSVTENGPDLVTNVHDANPLTADSDPDGDTFSVSQVNGVAGNVGVAVTGTSGGQFLITPTGSLTFSQGTDFDYLAAGETATTTATYTIEDADGATDTATVSVTVAGINDAPVLDAPITDQTNVDAAVIAGFDISGNFADADTTNALTFTATGLPLGLTLNPSTGVISGTIDSSASQNGNTGAPTDGVYTVIVTATDNEIAAATDTFTYTITNPQPVATDDAITTDEDTVSTGNLISDDFGNGPDSDPDGDSPLTVAEVDGVAGNVGQPVAGSAGGTFTINSDGTYSFDPGNDFNGLAVGEQASTTIEYQVTDGEGGFDTALVTMVVTGVNDAPVIIDPNDPGTPENPNPADPSNVIPTRTATDGEAFTVGSPLVAIEAYVQDPDQTDNANLVYTTSDILPAGLTLNADGTVTGTVDHSASQGGSASNGLYPITVTITDPHGASTTVDLTIDVSNLDPVAIDDASSNTEDAAQNGNVLTDITTGDSDALPDTDPLTVTDVDANAVSSGSPATVMLTNGSIVINSDGSWTFTPNGNANTLSDGETAVETVTYTVSDGEGGTDTATLTIEITGINDPVQIVDPNDPTTDPQDPSYDPSNPTVIPDPDNLIPDVAYGDGDTITPIPAGNYFGDAEGDLITFSASDLPTGLVIDPSTGEITGTLHHEASQGGNTATPGEYLVTITGTDPQGNTAATTVTLAITNPPPVAEDDDVMADEDTSVSGSVFADNGNGMDADTLPDTDPITVTQINGSPGLVGLPVDGDNGGVFTINPDGTFTFEPGNDFQYLAVGESAVTTISYLIDDANGGTDTALVTVTVAGINDAPIPVDPTQPVVIDPTDPTAPPTDPDDPREAPLDPQNYIPVQTTQDSTPVTVLDLTPYFGDPDGSDSLTLSLDPADLPEGLAFDPSTGTISGTPASDASQGGDPLNPGTYVIPVTVTDLSGTTFTTNVTYVVTNPAPIARDDALSSSEDAPVTASVFADNGSGSDNDPDGDTFFVSAVDGAPANIGVPVTGSSGGQFSINADGTVTFDPVGQFEDLAPGETRETSITYTISDAQGGTDTATVTVTVFGEADAPLVSNPALDQTSDDGETITPLSVAGIFTNPAGDPLTYTASGLPDGLLIDPVTGEIEGILHNDASLAGPYQVTVTATTPSGESASTQFLWNVDNPAPSAVNDQATTQPDTPVTLSPLGNDNDPDGDDLSVTGTTVPVNGTAAVNPDGTITYTPNPGFTGTDMFDYTIDDGQGGTSTATVLIEVSNTAPPGMPVATPAAPVIGQDGETIAPIDLSGNFTDPDGQPLVFTANDLPPGLTIDTDTGVVSGTIDPSSSQAGPYDVTVTATDPDGNTASVTFSYEVTNPAPTADDDSIATEPDTPVIFSPLGNDTDPDGDSLSVSEVAQPANGTASINPDGTLTYTPASGFTGTDMFTYTLSDGEGGFDTATVTVEVSNTPPPGIPTADPIPPVDVVDGEPVPSGTSFAGFFDDPDGQPLTFIAIGLPEGVEIDTLTGEITGTIPSNASVVGSFDVLITATDPDGNSVSQTVTINATNPAPVTGDDSTTTVPGTPVIISVMANDSDPDGDEMTIGGTTLPANGTAAVNSDGTITYTPNPGFIGTDTFSYTVDDGQGGLATAEVAVEVTSSPGGLTSAPLVPNQESMDGETATPLDVSQYVTDPENQPLAFSATGLPAGLTIDPASGVITGTFDPDASQLGDDPASPGVYQALVTVTDTDGAQTTIPLTYVIENIPPDARDDAVVHDEDGTASGDVFADNGNGIDADTPPDSDPIQVSAVDGNPAGVGNSVALSNGGTVTINSDGTYTFDPGSDFQDLDVGETRQTFVTYTIDDGNGGTDTAILAIAVEGANDAPVVIDPNDPYPIPNEPPVPADLDNVIPDPVGNDSVQISPLDVSPYFVDVDDEPLTFGFDPADPDVPAWLMIDPVTGIITGTPPSDASQGGPNGDGIYPLTITASDPDGEVVTTTVDFTFVNIPPLTSGLPDQVQTEGYDFQMSVVPGFTDPDGDILTYSATGLPPGLTIDPATGVISGTIENGAVVGSPDGKGNYTVTVTADDSQGGVVETSFTFSIKPLPHVQPPQSPIPLPSGDADGITQGSRPVDHPVSKAVNEIDPLGPVTGIGDLDHPVMDAIYKMGGYDRGMGLDPDGQIINTTVDWIERTRYLLANNPLNSSDDTQPGFYLGGDTRGTLSAGEDVILRSLVWDGEVFVEILATDGNGNWTPVSVDGQDVPVWVEKYGPNLFVLTAPAGSSVATFEFSMGNGETISVSVDLLNGQLGGVTTNEVSIGFSNRVAELVLGGRTQIRTIANL